MPDPSPTIHTLTNYFLVLPWNVCYIIIYLLGVHSLFHPGMPTIFFLVSSFYCQYYILLK